jgi:hypothetical protein
MYPNPVTNGILNVAIGRDDSNANAGIHIINAQGQTIIFDQIELVEDTNKKEYSISNWSEGIYFLRVVFNDGTRITRKFIKSDR